MAQGAGIARTQQGAVGCGESHVAVEQFAQHTGQLGKAGLAGCSIGQCTVYRFGAHQHGVLVTDDAGVNFFGDLAERDIPGQLQQGQSDPIGLVDGVDGKVIQKSGNGQNDACQAGGL